MSIQWQTLLEEWQERFQKEWSVLSDRRGILNHKLASRINHYLEIVFAWPPNTPLEVRELVGPEHFDSSNPK